MQDSVEDAEECDEGELGASEEWDDPAAHDLLAGFAVNLTSVIRAAGANVRIESVATITLRPEGVTYRPKLPIVLKVLLEAQGGGVCDACEVATLHRYS